MLLAHLVVSLGLHQPLLVFGRELRPVDRQRQFVELAGEFERHLIVLVVHRCAGVRADVEGLVPLHDERDRMLHFLTGHFLAVHLEYAGTALADAAQVVEGQRAHSEAVVLEVKLHGVFAGCDRLGAFPPDTLQVDQVPEKHRLAFQQVETVAAKPATRSQDDALGTALGNLHIRRDSVGRVEQQRGVALWDAGQRSCVGEHGSARRDVGPRRYETSCDGGVEWQHFVLARLLQEQLLQVFQLLRISRGNVIVLRPVLAQVVELPSHVIEGILVNWPDDLPRRPDHFRAGDPAIVIEGVVAHHLEILGVVRGWRVGVGFIPGIRHAHPFNRPLRDAVDHFGGGNAGGLEDGRHDVNDVVELVADAAQVRNVAWPRNRHSLPSAAEVRRNLLGPSEWRVERPGPAHGHVVVSPVRSPDVVEVLELILDRDLDTVEHGDFVGRANQLAFGARTIVAADIDDERVVELAHVLDSLDHTTNLIVSVGEVGGIDLDLANEHLFFVRA